MSEVLMSACCPSPMSKLAQFSSQSDWYPMYPTNPAVSAPSLQSLTSDARSALSHHATRLSVTGHEYDTLIAASKPLPPSRDSSPCIKAPEDTHLDDTVMSGDFEAQIYASSAQTKPTQQEQLVEEEVAVRRQDIIIPPRSTTSANSMPTPQLTFTKATAQADEELVEEEDEEELSGTPSELEDEGTAETIPKTAAERLAEKRKMKRFRLTHSQTRFLMSEFARQPHPDATQRDRLSRDIPGLSPRQVQVWFQNRRAKMKRLTGDDQERMIRSRVLPTGFELSRALQPGGSQQSQSPSALVHFAESSTEPYGGSQAGRSISRTDRRGVPPINMAAVYQNSPFSWSSVGGSSNASPSTSISGDITHSANQSPMFQGSQTSSPFLTAGNDNFQRQFVPGNVSHSAPGTSRARSGSLMSLPSFSPLSGGSPLSYSRESVSVENMQFLYQPRYQEINQQSPGLDPQIGTLANLPLRSPLLDPMSNQSSTRNLMRRNSSSTMPLAGAEESFGSAGRLNLLSHEQSPNADIHLQTHQIRRRQTQPTQATPQYQPSGMANLSPTIQSQGPFRSTTFPQARQYSPTHPMTAYATTPTLNQQARRPSFEAPPAVWQSSVGEHLSPTTIYQPQPQQSQDYQNQKFAGFYQASSHGTPQ